MCDEPRKNCKNEPSDLCAPAGAQRGAGLGTDPLPQLDAKTELEPSSLGETFARIWMARPSTIRRQSRGYARHRRDCRQLAEVEHTCDKARVQPSRKGKVTAKMQFLTRRLPPSSYGAFRRPPATNRVGPGSLPTYRCEGLPAEQNDRWGHIRSHDVGIVLYWGNRSEMSPFFPSNHK